jgi:hypothetical protein
MRWLRRRLREPDQPDAGGDRADGNGDGDQVFCATCGQALGFDPEDEFDGDAGLRICGECNRGRNFDAMLEGELGRD